MRRKSILTLVLILVLCLAMTAVLVGCNLGTNNDKPNPDDGGTKPPVGPDDGGGNNPPVNPDEGGGNNPPVNPDEGGGNNPPVDPDEGGGDNPGNPDEGGDVVTYPHIIFMVDGVEYARVECVGYDAINVEDPTKKNYNFDGWYLDAELSKWFDLDNVILGEIKEDITVYAKFVKIEFLEYRLLSDGTYEVTGIKSGIDATSIEIPATYDNAAVTSIASQAFLNKDKITSFTIPSSVVRIGEFAFSGCLALTSINAPNVTSLGKYAFNDCPKITEVEFSKDMAVVGEGVLTNSVGITKATIPTNMIASLPKDNLKELVINGGERIGNSAFENCAKLESVTINTNIQLNTIGAAAFKGCKGIKSITIPSTVTSIGNDAFADFGRLTIYAEAGSKPYSWSETWVPANCPVVWGHNNVKTNDTFDYVVHNGEAYLTRYKKYEVGVNIPNVIDGYNVVNMGAILAGEPYMEGLNIPINIREIGPYAIKDCTKLQKIEFAKESKLNNISKDAFSGCTNINKATIPTLVINVIPKANLMTIVINEGSAIEANAFENCTSLTNIVIAKDIEKIDNTAFTGCNNVASVEVPTHAIAAIPKDNLTNVIINGGDKIPERAFSNCAKLASIEIGKECPISEIGGYAFSNCTRLTEFVIPDSVTSICNRAFDNCGALTNITIPSSVTSLGEYALYNCRALKSVTILSTDISIGIYAFKDCYGLKSVNITDIAAWCGISFGDIETNPLSYAHKLYLNGELITNINIPSGVTSIGDYAFEDCESITSVSIPSSLTMIGKQAFSGNYGLEKVNITDMAAWCSIDFNSNPLTYAHNLYLNDELVTNLVIPAGVTTISNAFEDCDSITSITIPSSVNSIATNAFFDCTSLNRVDIQDMAAWCNISFANSLANPLYYAQKLYLNGTLVENVEIPDGVESIGDCAFKNCDSITSVTLPSSVTRVGILAFNRCASLVNVIMSNNVTDIDSAAFSGCSLLESVSLGENSKLTSIGKLAFEDCSSLTKIIIPNGVTSLGDNVFEKDISLTVYAEVASEPETWSTKWNISNCPVVWDCKNNDVANNNKIYIVDNGVRYALNDGVAIVAEQPKNIAGEITIPSTITNNGVTYDVTSVTQKAFYECVLLNKIILPDSITSIGNNAFDDCSALASMTLPYCPTHIGDIFDSTTDSDGLFGVNIVPSSLKEIILTGGTSIGSDAFFGCRSLQSITIPSSVTSVGSRAFDNCYGLERVNITDIAAWCSTGFGDDGANPLSYAHNLYLNGELVTNPNIPNSVTTIRGFAFAGCSSLTNVVVPNSVTSIGYFAFKGCDSLISITLPIIPNDIGYLFDGRKEFDNVLPTSLKEVILSGGQVISDGAFRGCSGLTSITIPNSVVTIREFAFEDCSSLTSIRIPKSVINMGSDELLSSSAFEGCISLASIVVDSENPKYTSKDINGNECNCMIEKSSNKLLIGCKNTIIPENVTSIDYFAFSRCTTLTSLIIPESVTNIYQYAFDGCTSLIIYAKAASQPVGWATDVDIAQSWNPSNRPVYWYSETEPTGTPATGNGYWHYDTDGKTPVVW